MALLFRPFTIITDGLRRKPLTPAERIYYYYVFRVFFAIIALVVQYIVSKLIDNSFFTNPRTWITELVFIVLYAVQTGIKQWFSIQGSVKGSAFIDNVTLLETTLARQGKIPAETPASAPRETAPPSTPTPSPPSTHTSPPTVSDSHEAV